MNNLPKWRKLVLPIGMMTLMFWNQPINRSYTIDGKDKVKGLRIVFLSDLHNTMYGKDQISLLKRIHKLKPDVILFGGDIIDEKSASDPSFKLFEGLEGRYDMYYVTGNHEHWLFETDKVFKRIEAYGIRLLRDEVVTLKINHQTIQLTGLLDPERQYHQSHKSIIEGRLEGLRNLRNPDYYQLLLAHRPEHVQIYERYNYDLALSGHAHGGQVRIPGILNGLYAPNQGFWPKYAGGYYQINKNFDFIVSRGLSFKRYLPRIMNPPEVVVIDLK